MKRTWFKVITVAVAIAAVLAISQHYAPIAKAGTRVVPVQLHLQVLTTCPGGASHCSLLTWTASTADATHDAPSSYNVYRGTTATACGTLTGAACLKVGSVATPNVTYTDSPLVAGQQYFYVVTAANSGGESVASNQVSVTPAASAPNAPTGLTGQVR
jgi:fibronectin type 3 domain-containing protein